MSPSLTGPSTAFQAERIIASGPLVEVALAVRAFAKGLDDAPVLVFDDSTGAVVDLDLRGTDAEIVARLAERFPPAPPPGGGAEPPFTAETAEAGARGRGRPKLGVVAREVTLLPRQWEWLAAQPGGASQVLRRLVDAARRADGGESARRSRHEAAYRFLSALAGDLPDFEEATRALFAGNGEGFAARTAEWPADIRSHARKLAGFAPVP